MVSLEDVFAAFGGPTALGKAIGVKPSTASEMKRRSSIPSEHWVALVQAAADMGRDDITFEALALIAASRKEPAA